MEIARKIFRAARECGFDDCGIIAPEQLEGCEKFLKERIEEIPSSAAFYANIAELYRPVRERFPWAKSVIVCTAEFGGYRYPAAMRGRYAKAFFLSPEEERGGGYDSPKFERWLTEQRIRWVGGDPVPLRYAAVKAGLGIVRRNNFLYTERGSNLNLTAYVSDCECTLIRRVSLRPCSPACGLCGKACLTGALRGPYSMDPMRCVSFWTTFGKGKIPGSLDESAFEEWLCGCDNCQDACPYNSRHDWDKGEPFSDLEEIAEKILPENVHALTDDFLIEEVIFKTCNHMMPADTDVLRRAAERALRNRRSAGRGGSSAV